MKRPLLLVLTALACIASAQPVPAKIGDDYAKAALRAVIAAHRGAPLSGPSLDRVVYLLDEADVEAQTPAEEQSLRELNRILAQDLSKQCYDALKKNLKGRDGSTPDACVK